jgi:hypothetical protein
MKKRFRILIPLTAGFLLSAGEAYASSELTEIESYFTGYRFRLTYREPGRPVYGTDTVAEVHYCPSGRYWARGQNSRLTVLDNWQTSNWSDAGVWDVSVVRGTPVLRYMSDSGRRDSASMRLTRDGGVALSNGANLMRLGRATCR